MFISNKPQPISVKDFRLFIIANLYIDRPEPIAFMPVAVDTSGRIYDDFLRLLFWHTHREASVLANDIPGGIRSLSFSSRCLFT
jgi:hypothetical protein